MDKKKVEELRKKERILEEAAGKLGIDREQLLQNVRKMKKEMEP